MPLPLVLVMMTINYGSSQLTPMLRNRDRALLHFSKKWEGTKVEIPVECTMAEQLTHIAQIQIHQS